MSAPFKQADDTRKVLTAGEDATGRLDAWLADALGGEHSRSRIKALIETPALLFMGDGRAG